MKEFEFFKLEERVLFEAAAAAEIVAAADAADAASQDQSTAEQNDSEPDSKRNVESLNCTPLDDNNAAPELPSIEPEKLTDVDAELDALISGVTSGNTEVEAVENVVQNDVSEPRELVVVDSSLRDIETIEQQLRPNQDILILQQGNGLTELNVGNIPPSTLSRTEMMAILSSMTKLLISRVSTLPNGQSLKII